MKYHEFLSEGEVVDLGKFRLDREKQEKDARYNLLAQRTKEREAAFKVDYDALRDALYELRSKRLQLFGWRDTNYAEILSFIDDLDTPRNYGEYSNWYKNLKPEDQTLVVRTFGNRENVSRLKEIVNAMGRLVLDARKKYNMEPYFGVLAPRLNSIQEQLGTLTMLSIVADKMSKKSINESKTVRSKIDAFVQFAADKIKLKHVPKIVLKYSKKDAQKRSSFGGYRLEHKDIHVNVAGRHLADILRTLAHELVHARQDQTIKGGLQSHHGETGSPYEDEANSVAGQIMRDYAKTNPAIFESRHAPR